MNLQIIAKVCEEIYYNGRPKANKGLKYIDLLQIGKMAKGYTILGKYWAVQGDFSEVAELYPSMLKRIEAKVMRPTNKRPHVCIPEAILDLPNGYGVYQVSPSEEDDEKELLPFFRGRVGDSWVYSDSSGVSEDFGVTTYEVVKDKIFFNGIAECVSKVELVIIPAAFDDKEEIPMDIAYEIMNHILATVLKVKGFPVDMTNDNDPNVSLVKGKLADPEK